MGGSEEEMKIIIKIMECKGTSLTKVSEALSNQNRDIMECKGCRPKRTSSRSTLEQRHNGM